MAKPKRQTRTTGKVKSSPDEAPVTEAVTTTRVDPAHLLGERAPDAGVAEGAPADLAAAARAFAEPVAAHANAGPSEIMQAAQMIEQVRTQASQLSAHLRRQQASVDHREAELNSRQAAIDNQVRGARLWLAERQQEITTQQAALEAQRQAQAGREKQLQELAGSCQETKQTTEVELRRLASELAQRESELAARMAQFNATSAEHVRRLEVRQHEIEEREPALAERRKQLNTREQELDQRQSQIEESVKRLAAQIALGQKAQQLQEALAKLESRREHLDEAEKLLVEQEGQIEAEHCAWPKTARPTPKNCMPSGASWPTSAGK